jgi:hypothetical protein
LKVKKYKPIESNAVATALKAKQKTTKASKNMSQIQYSR